LARGKIRCQRSPLFLLSGEPGIGKTALCQRLSVLVAAQGGRALVGRCDDAGPLSVPYLPFIETLHAAFGDQDSPPSNPLRLAVTDSHA
jgi:predicted ATPase